MGGNETPTTASHDEGCDVTCHEPVLVAKRDQNVAKSKGSCLLWEQKVTQLQKVACAQDHQISAMCKQLAFLRLGFTPVQPASYFDAKLVAYWRRNGYEYKRDIHRCILVELLTPRFDAAKSRVFNVRLELKVEYELPKLQYKSSSPSLNRIDVVFDYQVYDAFVDYFYVGFMPANLLQQRWKDILVLATEFEVAALKEQCEQYVEGNEEFKQDNILDILELGLQCDVRVFIRRAIDAHLKDAGTPLIDIEGAPYRNLVQRYPHLQDWMCQAERLCNSRKEEAWLLSEINVQSN